MKSHYSTSSTGAAMHQQSSSTTRFALYRMGSFATRTCAAFFVFVILSSVLVSASQLFDSDFDIYSFAAISEKTHKVTIAKGSSDSNSTKWYLPQEITVSPRTAVEWENIDSTAHTVTSGSPKEGSDGKFDSGMIEPQESWSNRFNKQGPYEYYCTIHPWMVGTVNVVDLNREFKTITGVGSKVGDGRSSYTVEYASAKEIVNHKIDVKENAITFTMIGVVQGGDRITLKLPKGLVEGPFAVFVDGSHVTEFTDSTQDGFSLISLPLDAKSENITIVGKKVVPEFGILSFAVLGLSVSTMLVVLFYLRKNSSMLFAKHT